jgi:hypothetical protein
MRSENETFVGVVVGGVTVVTGVTFENSDGVLDPHWGRTIKGLEGLDPGVRGAACRTGSFNASK